eukprot:4347904-Pleurochrysis_carterae.AAC.1
MRSAGQVPRSQTSLPTYQLPSPSRLTGAGFLGSSCAPTGSCLPNFSNEGRKHRTKVGDLSQWISSLSNTGFIAIGVIAMGVIALHATSRIDAGTSRIDAGRSLHCSAGTTRGIKANRSLNGGEGSSEGAGKRGGKSLGSSLGGGERSAGAHMRRLRGHLHG